MESSEHNWANISETICPAMLIFGKWDVVLSEYLDKSNNFTNLILMTSPLQNSIVVIYNCVKKLLIFRQHGLLIP